MIILEAEICFDTKTNNPHALPQDVTTDDVIRPAINFGNNLLFSGTIAANKNVDTLLRGVTYNVLIETPTIEKEAYAIINFLIYPGKEFKMQTASRVIGKGTIIDFLYE